MTNTLKDIILPIAQILSTLLVGGALAYYLNRRTNRDKIKGLLIDSYMEYLSLYKKIYMAELSSFSMNVYKKILENKKVSLNISIEKELEKTIETIKEQYSQNWFEENANMAVSTYKFSFLLGSKRYFEKLQPLETKWLKHLVSFENRQELVNKIATKIIDDESIKKISLTANTKDYLRKSESIIEQVLTSEYFKDFRSYSAALASEVDQY